MPTLLPSFSFESIVSPNSGRQDKIELNVSMGRLEGSTHTIDLFREHLAVPPEHQRNSLTEDEVQNYNWIFNRPESIGSRRPPLKIRERNLMIPGYAVMPPFLFTGQLKFSSYVKQHDFSHTTSELHLKLYLNPSRFTHYQQPRFRKADGINILPSELKHQKSTAKPKYRKEFPLDEGDNWVFNTQRAAYFFGPRSWPIFVENYITGTFSIIESTIQNAVSLARVEWVRPESPKIDIRYIENYWEFQTPEPLKIVSLCEPLLRQYSENQSKSRRYKTYQSGVLTHNSRSCSVQVKTGVELAIYSKTNNRVRVEVRHRLTDRREVVGNTITSFGISTLLRKIRLARNNASTIVNDVFAFMRSRNTFEVGSVSVGQFLFEMVNAIGNWQDAGVLLSMLLENGKIVIDSRIKEQVHALKKAGILQAQLKNKKRCYVATERYLLALKQLRKQNQNLLAPRKRIQSTRVIRNDS